MKRTKLHKIEAILSLIICLCFIYDLYWVFGDTSWFAVKVTNIEFIQILMTRQLVIIVPLIIVIIIDVINYAIIHWSDEEENKDE